VDGYTLDQVHAFSGAIDRSRRRRHQELAILIRAGSQYDNDTFEKFLQGPP